MRIINRNISQLGLFIVLTIIFASVINLIESAAIVAIDFGNEWVKVGVVSPGVPMEIALNKESKRKTPAILAYRDNIRTFGEDAQSIGVKFPSKAYGYLFDLLGKTIDNPIVELYRKRFPYYEIIGDNERNTVVFKDGEQIFKIEELIAQIIRQSVNSAVRFVQQPISECVLIVPGYFGQAERMALLTAADLASIKVLQLINDYTAVALNYGVFHRNEINETAQYFVYYDMGAQKTSAAVISYQLIKDKQTRETNPVVHVLGVGYDRTLGGLDIQLRLRDYLAKEFNAMKKTKTDVFTNPRALAKLFKEAGRLKNVLSANNDHFAQIENLIEDHDYKIQVTREQLEDLCKDLWPRVVLPLRNALKSAGLSLDVIQQVIIFGGGTRMPKIQEILRDEIKQELGKSLNADEAAVMGAVYKAADLATGFKVKKFIIKDAVLFPIQVAFERDPGEGSAVKQVKRLLFGQMNTYPQKKVITFNKHTDDFDFYVNYADLNYLNEDEIKFIGSLNLTRIEVKNVADVLQKNQGEDVETKGIKAHFTLDDSGLFSLSGIDFVFDKQKSSIADDESTLSKLGSTISKLFTGDKKPEEQKTEETPPQNESKEDEKLEESTEKLNKTNETSENANKTEGAAKNETTVRVVTQKIPMEHVLSYKYTKQLIGDEYDKSYEKLNQINVAEAERIHHEVVFNSLESHIIDTQDKLSQDEYSNCATNEEVDKIMSECSTANDWLYDHGTTATATELEKRFADLKKLSDSIFARHWEHQERPEALKTLTGMTEHAEKFLENAKNLTKDTNPDKDIFTQVEIDVLEKAITETKEWQKNEIIAQDKLKRNESVRLTIKSISEKMSLLDREVKYLVNKLKIWRPKKPIKKDKPINDDNINGTTTDEASGAGIDDINIESIADAELKLNETIEEQMTNELPIDDKKIDINEKEEKTSKKSTEKSTKKSKDNKKSAKTKEGDQQTQEPPHGGEL